MRVPSLSCAVQWRTNRNKHRKKRQALHSHLLFQNGLALCWRQLDAVAADPRPGSGNAAIVNKRAVPTRDTELVIRAPIEKEEGKKPMPEKRKREEEGGGDSKVRFLKDHLLFDDIKLKVCY